MSKKVDERVVEMRFDNAQFESATKQTMSTLDKLKNALKFPSSSKSLDNLSKAAKGVDFSGMAKGIETVNARFSAMQVIGMTALSNITSAVMRAGSNLVNSFTMEPVISGFREYETQLNSVQTILANTSSKGTTMDQVTAALDELNTYADQTIYNFTEMTRNIGTFTAAGVDLETSVSAIKGIANLAAVSGSTSQQASTAMYQLSQALAAGRVSLMDWNSVVNAGMGGEVFQNALKRTATVMGKDVDGLIEKYGSFRESLTSGEWLTTDVLTATLEQFTMAAEEGSKEWDEFKKSLMDTGYTEAQAIEILKMANTATDAATKVKTFTQLMDTLKEAMGSGWAKTWQLIFGDFEEAKEFWTGISDGLGDMINNFSDARNNVIAEAMGMGGGESRFGEFTAELEKAGVSVDEFQSKLAEVYSAASGGGSLDELITQYGSLEDAMGSGSVTADMVAKTLEELSVSTDKASGSMKALADWQKVVDDVWYGTYGNIDTGRMERLAAAGWEYAEVQKLVNMTVDGHRLTLEDLTAAQIESMGYTKEQAEALASLAQEASKSGSSLNGLINDILEPKKSGRELFLEGLENMLNAILKPLKAVAGAFNDVFGMNADQLFNLIKGFNEFSKAIVISDTDAENLRSTFKGLFSIIHLLGSIFSKSLTMGIKAANAVLAPFETDLLTVTGVIGEAFYAFDQWISSGTMFEDTISAIGDALSWVITPLQNFLAGFSNLPGISTVVAKIKGLFDTITGYFSKFDGLSAKDIFTTILTDIQNAFTNAHEKIKNLKWEDILNGLRDFGKKVGEFFTTLVDDMKEIGPDIIEGLQNGLTKGVEGVLEFLRDLATKIIEAVKAVLGIHSPSTVFFEIGVNIIEGLCEGIKYVSGQVSETIRALVDDIKYALSGIDWGVVLPVAGAVGSFAVLYQLTDALQGFSTAAQNFSKPFASIGGIGDSLKTTVDGFNNLMGFSGQNKSKGFKQIADGVKVLAEAIAILAGSVVALTLVDQGKLWVAVGAIGALAVIIGVLAVALSKFANGGTVLESLQLNSVLLSLGASFVLLAAAAKILGTMDASAVDSAQEMLLTFAGVISILVLITQWGNDLEGASKVLSKVGIAFILLGVAAKLLGGMDRSQMDSAQEMLLTFAGVISILVLVTQFGNGMDQAAQVIFKVGTTFLLLGIAAKIMGSMSPAEMNVAISAITAFGLVIAGLMAATKLIGGNNIDGIGDTILKVSAAIGILAVVAALIGGVDTGQLIKGGIAVTAFGAVVLGLMYVVKLMGPGEAMKIGTSLLAMSLAIGILAGISALLGLLDPGQLAQGLVAIGLLSLMMMGLTKATAGASDVKGTFLGMAVAIGVLAASVAVLSLLDPARVAGATACMTILMAMLALVAKSASNVQTSIGVMIALAAVIAVMGGIVALLSNMPVEGVIASAASLSVMLLTLAGVLKILDSIKSISTNVLVSVGILTAVMAALGLILAMMTALNVQSAIPNAIALSTMLLAMSAAMVILGTVSSVSMTVMAGMGILTAIMAGLGLVLAMMSALGVQDAIPNAIALSTLALAMSGVMVILSAIGPMASAAIPAAGAMAAVIGIMAGIVAAAGAIAQIPGVDWLVSEGAGLLQKIGEAIGGFVGGIVGGVLEGATSTLPQVGQNLSSFAMQILPFIMTMKMVDSSVIQSCTDLATAIAALTGAGFLESITSFFTGGSSLTKFAEELVPFGEGMAKFAGSLEGVNLAALMIGAQAAKALAEMANNLPTEGGAFSFFTGETMDMGTFGTNLESFGAGLKSYGESVTGLNAEAIQASIEPAKALNELAKQMPSSGGILDSIFGTQTDLSTFGEQLKNFGDGLTTYANTVNGLNTEAIQASIPAAQALNDLAKELPSGGGFMQSIFGGQDDLSGFGGKLESFGTALSKYGDSVADLEIGQMNSATNAVRQIISMLSYAANMDENGFTNAKKLPQVAEALSDYNDNMEGVDPATISASAQAISSLKDTINGLVGLDSSGIAAFQSAIDSLASTNVQSLIAAFEGLDLSQAGSNLMTSFASGIQSGSAKVISTIQAIGTLMIATIKMKQSEWTVSGTLLVTQLANAIANGRSRIMSSVRSALSSAAATIRSYYGTFYSAGSYISSGMAAGMNSKLYQIRSAASAMVQAAATATTAAARIASPSRLFMGFGEYMGEGLTIGMENKTRSVYKAGALMGDSAYDGIKTTMSRISDVLNSDLDVNPTIRPVLDLTEIKNGANYINDTFSNLTPDSTLSRVSTINRSMNSRIQNGTFDDVVSAIDKLRGTVSELERPTYNVAGITYDDGSAVATAVNQLTRAIRIERRT